jgi:hypothetical protein
MARHQPGEGNLEMSYPKQKDRRRDWEYDDAESDATRPYIEFMHERELDREVLERRRIDGHHQRRAWYSGTSYVVEHHLRQRLGVADMVELERLIKLGRAAEAFIRDNSGEGE